MRAFVLSIFLMFFGPFRNGISQTVAYFDQHSIKNGLSQSSVNHLVQDKYGIIWIATQDGLNRYSYNENKTFNHIPFDKNSISGNRINDLFTDKEGNIWMLSNGGVDYIDPMNFKITHVVDIKATKLFESIFKTWIADSSLVLNTNKGLFVLNNYSRPNSAYSSIHQTFKAEERLIVYSSIPKNNSDFLLATNQGFLDLSLSNKTIALNKDLAAYKKSNSQALKNNILTFSDKNRIYTYHILNGKVNEEIELSANVKDFKFHPNNELWVGTEGEGVFVLKKYLQKNEYAIKHHFKSSHSGNELFTCNYTTKIHIDTSFMTSNVWIGTKDEGVFCYNYNKNIFNFLSAEAGIPEKNFFAITKDEDKDIWIVSVENLYCVDDETKSWRSIRIKEISEEVDRPIECIYCDKNNNIWFGLGNALYKINKTKFKIEKIIPSLFDSKINQVFKILQVSDEDILLVTSEGITEFNTATSTFKSISELKIGNNLLEIKKVNAGFIDSRNNIWLRTAKGVLVYNKQSGFNKLFQHDPQNTNSLLSNSALDINELKNGEIIIATVVGFSILKDAKSGIFKNYTKSNSFKNSVVYSVIPDNNGNVWMTTNYGIYVFDPRKETFTCFDSESGGFLNEYNSNGFYFSGSGNMFFSGIGGVVEVDPNTIGAKMDSIPLYSTLYYNGKSKFTNNFSGSNIVELAYDKSEVEFNFDLPYYFNNNLEILYTIKEANATWQSLGNNKILRQENLAPGKYTFEFKVEDQTGRVKFIPTTYSILIKPPLWNTPWFYLLLVTVMSVFSFLFYKTRLNRKISLLKEIELVRSEENEKVRQAAAMDLHDEFGNGLTRISMLVEVAKDKLAPESNEVLTHLNTISESSGRLYQGTKDFIWSINPNNETLFETLIRIKDYADELFKGTGIIFEFEEIPDKLKQIKNTPAINRNITMIFKESLSNILKHSSAKKCALNINLTNNDIFISLKDNGRGFDINTNKGGYGLGNIKLRAKKINAEIGLTSEEGKGTELTLKFKRS